MRQRSRFASLVPAVVVALAIAAAGLLSRRPAAPPNSAGAAGADIAFYTCAMDPSVEATQPGSCPVCGMALTPVSKEDRQSGVVRLSPEARQRMGAAVTAVQSRALPRRVVAGGEVEPGASAARAVVNAKVYRGEAAAMLPGRTVAVSFAELPLQEISGTIVAGPAPLRVAIENRDRLIKSGMHAEVMLTLELPARLVVPAQAVLYAGTRRIAFVEHGSGRFEPRTLTLGVEAGGLVQVLEGLAADEQVLIAGTFLVAAESRLRAGALWSDPIPKAPPKRPNAKGNRP